MRRLQTVLTTTLLAMLLMPRPAYAAPGKLDPGFGAGGVVTTATAPGAGADFQNGLAIQRDDRILVGGESDMGIAAGGLQWRISRYTRIGALDRSFGIGGTVTTSMSSVGGEDENIWQLAVQPNGKIVGAGEAKTMSGGFDLAVARYNSDGTVDSGFGNGGRVITAIGPGAGRDLANRVLIDANGRILVAGQTNSGTGAGRNNFLLARYNPDGTFDSSFGTGGVVVTVVAPGDNADAIAGMAIDGSGRIVVAGIANMGTGAGGFNFAIARYDTDGTLDNSFDGDGIVITPMAPGDNSDRATRVAIDANGKIVAAGHADMGGGFVFDLALARYNPDGSLDASFGMGGKVTTNVGPGDTDDDLEGLVIQSTGKLLVGGSTAPTDLGVDSDFMVARYNPDGTLDNSFGAGGIVTTPTGAGNAADEIYDIALQSDAKLVASGECDQASTGRDVCVARYKAGETD